MVPPSGDLVLIVLAETLGNPSPLFVLDGVSMDLGHSSAMRTSAYKTLNVRICRSDSRSQLADRTYDGLAECTQGRPLESPVENYTHLTTGPPKVDVILFVCHRVLGNVSHKLVFAEQGKHTLIVAKRILTEAKAV